MNELFRLGPRCFPNRLNEEINEHSRDDERRNPARRPVGDFDVRDTMGQHNRKKNQNQNATHIKEQLYRRHKIGAEKHIKPGCTRERPEKRKRGIDDVARKRYHKRRTHRDQGDQIKNCRREVHSSFNFGALERQRLFWLKYRKTGLGSRGAENYYKSRPLFAAYPSSAAAPPSGVANSSKYFSPMSTFSTNLGSVSPPFLGL